MRPRDPAQLDRAAEIVHRVTGATVERAHRGELTAVVGGESDFAEVAVGLRGAGVDVTELALRLPSLDEAFHHLTRVSDAAAPDGEVAA